MTTNLRAEVLCIASEMPPGNPTRRELLAALRTGGGTFGTPSPDEMPPGWYSGKTRGTVRLDGEAVRVQGSIRFLLDYYGDPEEDEWNLRRMDTREIIPWDDIERHIDERDWRDLSSDALDDARLKQVRKADRSRDW